MIVVEVVAAVILFALVAASAWMAIVGLLGVIGFVRLRRCRSCGHLMPSSATVTACPYCRPHRLVHHPVHARLHHYLPGEW